MSSVFLSRPNIGSYATRAEGALLWVVLQICFWGVVYKLSVQNITVNPNRLDCGIEDFDGLAQNCSNSIANALELLQSCASLVISLFCTLLWKYDYVLFLRQIAQDFVESVRTLLSLSLSVGSHMLCAELFWWNPSMEK